MSKLLLLGVGQVATAVIAEAAPYAKITATTRNPQRIFEFAASGIEPIVLPAPSAEIVEPISMNADVLVSFPPDGQTDVILAPACKRARCIVYISSTGVYGKHTGIVDENTPPDQSDLNAEMRLAAEDAWRSVGANVVRAPGIYGPKSGFHSRLKDGSYKMPGDGSNYSSRIHVEDLAAIVLRIFELQLRKETFVVGDLEPATQAEVVGWLCQRMGCAYPESVPPDSVHYTLRANRRVNPSKALSELSIKLRYPSYREGFEQCLGIS